MELKKLMRRNYKVIGFCIGTILIFADLLICNVRETYGDANGYSLMANYFKQEGLFNFYLNIPQDIIEKYLFSIRGYAWPFIMAVCKIFSMDTQIGYWFFAAIFMSSGLAYALPEVFEKLFEKKVSIFQRIIPIIITILFWNGLIIYPLSDIPSVVTVSWALMLLIKISSDKHVIINLITAVLCGVCLGVSYYIRSGCKPIVFLALAIVIVYKLKKQYVKKIGVIVAMLLGIGISAVPQIMLNISSNNVNSYEVPIFFTSGIEGLEYYSGIKDIRYETNITGIHPEVVMLSSSKLADNILAAEDIEGRDVKISTVLKLAVKYPLEFLGLYTTKFANYIDPRYGNEVYVKDLNSRQYLIMVSNFLLWLSMFLGLGIQINRDVENGGSSQFKNIKVFFQRYFLYIFAFILPALIHLAGTHVEARYFYPCYVILYMYLASECPWKEVWNLLKKKTVTIAIVSIALFGCVNSIWNFTFEDFNYSSLFFEHGYSLEKKDITTLIEENHDELNINYDVWSLEMTNGTHLKMSGYIVALEKDSSKSELKLALCSADKVYLYEINITDNMNEAEMYRNSKFSIDKELVGLDAGEYQMGLILENEGESKMILLNKTIVIQK
ncbi:hypothetical protein EDD76_10492 [Kineothrix alysoides]|uniref:Dolichyl-phosphate-mannose-protein mannosyltransferase n=1 Tax=Kineothrix alysoides TaxID=1469948 RepID=A0A4R1R1X5_9FIRM|nr:hypothetical protein [Kineothrix alysoides]TCL59355.1 hypothetical protein EDD76_10492 [Kineothrix alysoides]